MLGTLPEKNKSTWEDYITMFVNAYNCTENNTTEFSPCILMYGHKPQLPSNLHFGTQTSDLCVTSSTNFVQQLKDRLKCAYKVAQKVNEKERKTQAML